MRAILRRCAFLVLAAVAMAHGETALALTCQSNAATGNWNVAGTWTGCGGGVPGAGDDVQIRLGHVVTIPAGYGAVALSVQFTATNGAARIDHAAATSTLTVGAGGVTMNPSGNNNLRTWNINAGSATVNGNVTLNGTSTNARPVRIFITTGTLDINGNLSMNAGSAVRAVIDMSGGAGNLFIAGSFTLASSDGTLTPGTTSTVTFDSAATPVTVQTGSSIAYNHLVIAKGAGNVANAATTGNLTVGGNLTVTSGTFNIPGITASVTGTTAITGTLAFITAAAGTKTFTGNVTVSGGGAWANNTINSPISLGGSLTNDGTFSAGTGLYTFNGAAAQSIGGAAGNTTFGSLTLNNANGLSLAGTHDLTVSTLLTLTAGRVTTGSNVVIVSNGSSIAGAGANTFVNGNLRKSLATGASVALNFEVGSESGGVRYAPVTGATFATVSVAGSITASTTASDHPSIATSGIDSTLDVNRYWTLANSGATFASYVAVFNFVAADLDAGADTTTFDAQFFSPPTPAAGTWTSATVGTRTATSTQVTGVGPAAFGDFAVGQPLAAAGGIGRFNVYDTTTAAGAVSGSITTKVAGTFSVDVIAIRNNRKSIDTSFTGNVTVDLLNASDNSGTLDTVTGCRTSWTVIQTMAMTFVGADNGRRTLSVTETNVWREARFRATDVATGSLIGCSTDALAIRPASFTVAVTDATWATAGTARVLDNVAATGGNVHKAGQPFTITVTPSPGTATNYDGSPTISALACSLPGGCVNGTLTVGAYAGAGTRVSSTATYSEAGAFNLTLVDQSFAVIDSTDGTPADCTAAGRYVCQSSSPLGVGRFVPDRFVFAGASTPVFLTFGSGTCVTPLATRSFTYVGQSFWYATLPSATMVNAVNAAGTLTQNYPFDTSQSRPTFSEVYADGAALATLNTGAILSPPATSGAGTGSYSAAALGQLSYTRSTTIPIAPFNAAISLTVTASDATEAPVTGNGTITTPTPLVFNGGGTGIAFDGTDFNATLTGGKTMVFGRLRLANANGSQLVPMLVRMETQYYSGAPANAFLTNTADSCTSIDAVAVAMGGYTANLSDSPTCETALSGGGGFSSGRKTLILAAPGSGNNGSVTLTANLNAASGNTCTTKGAAPVASGSANALYLQGNWTTTTFTQNPVGRATFGAFPGTEEVIFIRENFQ